MPPIESLRSWGGCSLCYTINCTCLKTTGILSLPLCLPSMYSVSPQYSDHCLLICATDICDYYCVLLYWITVVYFVRVGRKGCTGTSTYLKVYSRCHARKTIPVKMFLRTSACPFRFRFPFPHLPHLHGLPDFSI